MTNFLKQKKNSGFIRQNFSRKISGGFMMVEILVAAAIIVSVVLAAMAVTQKAIQISYQSLHASQASFLLEEGAEAIRIARDNSWDNISNLNTATNYYPLFSGNTWTLSTSSSQIGKFTRKVNMQNVNRDVSTGDIVSSGGTLDSDTKLFTITVFWSEGGKTITKTLQFYLTNIFS